MRSLSRRDVLRFGTVQLGLLGAWPDVEAAERAAHRARARACILLFMDGGPSHIDTWDMKPDAPAEVRGEFRPIRTSVPGILVCEHMPRIARQMHRFFQIRSVCHEETVHDPAVYQVLTGRRHQNSGGDLTVQPTDAPHMGAALARVDPYPSVLPPFIELPETMRMGARVLPGQNGGFLGGSYDPFRIAVTRAGEVVLPPLEPAVPTQRLARRATLLQAVERRLIALERAEAAGPFDRFRHRALAMLARPEVRRSFDLDAEPPALRERYGNYRHGRSVLLARRLVEAGARFVTVYWGQEMQDWADGRGLRLANNPWDTHRNHFPLVRDELLPRADRTLAALVEDLHDRGLLDETLVVWMGEFGRTPRISDYGSRDHWPYANTVVMAGAGLPGGAVYGSTDSTASEVTECPVSPADITATIFDRLGVDPGTPIRDPAGRPVPISPGRPLRV